MVYRLKAFVTVMGLAASTSTIAGPNPGPVSDPAIPNERLPPDFFKKGDGYFFNPNLEKPCQSRSGFCPNYEGGVPENWVMARYKSRHAGGFDSGTPNLLMVYIPKGALVNGQPDNTHRWLNFALPVDPPDLEAQPTPRTPIPSAYSSDYPRTFTMVSVTEGAGNSPSTVHFQKFYRDGDDDIYRPESESFVGGCNTCHPNGLRHISPLGYHVDGQESLSPDTMLEETVWNDVDKINRAMEKVAHGKPFIWDQDFKPSERYRKIFGPSEPASDRYRTQQGILGTNKDGCAYAQTEHDVTDIFGRAPGMKNIYKLDMNANLDWEKIRDAMSCESCHNHTRRGALTENTGIDQIYFKILVDQSMPDGSLMDPYSNSERAYGNELDINHRIALANCLTQEFNNIVNGRDLPTDDTPTPPATLESTPPRPEVRPENPAAAPAATPAASGDNSNGSRNRRRNRNR